MHLNTNYNPNSSFSSRFISHAQLGICKETLPHEANLIEKLGDSLLWSFEELPQYVWEKISEPRVATVGLTSFALLSNSILFYPSATWACAKSFFNWIPLPSLSTIRLTSYLYTSSLILGYGLRAFGRFSNPALMNEFYKTAVRA